jgi:hypothetical protein
MIYINKIDFTKPLKPISFYEEKFVENFEEKNDFDQNDEKVEFVENFEGKNDFVQNDEEVEFVENFEGKNDFDQNDEEVEFVENFEGNDEEFVEKKKTKKKEHVSEEYQFLKDVYFHPNYLINQSITNQRSLKKSKKRVNEIKNLLVDKHDFTFNESHNGNSCDYKFFKDSKQMFNVNFYSKLYSKYMYRIVFTQAPEQFEKKYNVVSQNSNNDAFGMIMYYDIISFRDFKKLMYDYVYFLKQEEIKECLFPI